MKSDDVDQLYTQPIAPPRWVNVYDVSSRHHTKPGKTPTLWVKYVTAFEGYSGRIYFEQEGYTLDKARAWWM
jgi:hypothetical protein